jgi:RNA-splicing ligase RtcB
LVSLHEGVKMTGIKPIFQVTLQNKATLKLTSDHEVYTKLGWKRADTLSESDQIAYSLYQGIAYEEPNISENPMADILPNDPILLGALMRILGVVSGDGHLNKDQKQVSIYTTDQEDADAMVKDLTLLGYTPHVYTRQRKENYKAEVLVRVNSIKFHAILAKLGSPVGRKAWPANPMPWLFALPNWARAQFLAGFASAECMTPRYLHDTTCNFQIKQSGENCNAICFIAQLTESLGFETSVAPSGKPRGERRDHVMQILGGGAAQVEFMASIGFCYAGYKRRRAAEVASVYWQRQAQRQVREEARLEAKRLHGEGMHWKEVKTQISEKYGVSQGFVHHAIYDDRGVLRRERGAVFTPDVTDEIVWVPVQEITEAGESEVYDIVTYDEAHAFYANGFTVHNCGNKAVLLDIPAREVKQKIKKIMDDIWKNLSFGVGRNNEERVDHEIFEDERWKRQPFKHYKQMAQNQLGTIGSGVCRLLS